MDYVTRAPVPPLDRFIDDIYCLSGIPRHRRINVPPMPSAHLLISLSGSVRLHDPDPAVPPEEFTDGCFMGVCTRRFLIEYGSPVRVMGIHFKPWGISPFVDFPSTELRDRRLPVDAVWRGSLDRLRDRLHGAPTAVALQMLEDELLSRLAPTLPRGLELVTRTAGRMEATWGAVPIAALADRAGVGVNRLADQFKSHLGVTPKRMARIYRFARLVLSVDSLRPVDWSGLAHATGYFDQAHLSKEFKEFTGHTPTEYLALRRRFPAQEAFPPDNGPIPAE